MKYVLITSLWFLSCGCNEDRPLKSIQEELITEAPIGVWRKVADLQAGSVNQIWSDTIGNFYAACDSGIFRSKNSGASWEKNLKALGVNCIVGDSNGQALIAGYAHGTYRSLDGGDHWVTTSMADTRVSRMIDVDGIVFATTEGSGLLCSTNGGTSWSSRNNGLHDTYTMSLATNSNSMYLGAYYDLYVSHDKGVTWLSAHSGLVFIEAIATVNDKTVIACDNHASVVGVSHDRGNTWNIVRYWDGGSNILTEDSAAYLISGIVWKSLDEGDTWLQYGDSLPHESRARSGMIQSHKWFWIGTWTGEIYTLRIR